MSIIQSTGITKSYYGVVGEKTGFCNLCVGDLVVASFKERNEFHGVIVELRNTYYVMGACGTPIHKLGYIYRVLSHELVTNEIIKELHDLEIKESTKLTVSQVSELLGYPVEIVEQ